MDENGKVKSCFWEKLLENGEILGKVLKRFRKRGLHMRKRNYKGRCQKRKLEKCKDVCRTYDDIQYAYAEILQDCETVKEIRCNVLLDGLLEGEYTSDFVCVKNNNDLMVRECVYRKYLMKPLTVKLLDASKEYWSRHGVQDWGLVIDAE